MDFHFFLLLTAESMAIFAKDISLCQLYWIFECHKCHTYSVCEIKGSRYRKPFARCLRRTSATQLLVMFECEMHSKRTPTCVFGLLIILWLEQPHNILSVWLALKLIFLFGDDGCCCCCCCCRRFYFSLCVLLSHCVYCFPTFLWH